MKKLTLVRHAKSSWDYEVDDFDRPLATRGITDAILISNLLKAKNYKPQKVFSSPAKRAFQTCNILMANLKVPLESVKTSETLYDFGGHQLTSFIKDINDKYDNVMVFGHNHAITAFSNAFGDKGFDNVPTCGTVMFEFNIVHWKDLNKGITVMHYFPKEYR
ncbi:SixA phosphatase family protein [Mangrovimonas aestuarii]|uniref:SixA phosphatase family protein n=1 Tax=Mangrovimonas aestuarii TaxID=3018443 RepID=UPI002378FBB9|nr:histidine phosphatase family protein [Mangrovimonas aestuarii]